MQCMQNMCDKVEQKIPALRTQTQRFSHCFPPKDTRKNLH